MTDIIVTINREDYERAKRLHLKTGGAVYQIHSVGVDKKRFAPKKEINEAKRKELGIRTDAFHIVTAAELNDNKNQKIIIDAVATLPQKDICYSICGKGSGERTLRELIREKGLEDRVRLLGFRTDMEEILQTADCFVVSDNRGTREYAVKGKNAFVCRADSASEFAQAIDTLYREKELRTKMAQNCRSSAMKFTTEEVEKTMKDVYRRALNA